MHVGLVGEKVRRAGHDAGRPRRDSRRGGGRVSDASGRKDGVRERASQLAHQPMKRRAGLDVAARFDALDYQGVGTGPRRLDTRLRISDLDEDFRSRGVRPADGNCVYTPRE